MTAYAIPDSYLRPSEMGYENERKWYDNHMTSDPSLSEEQNFQRAFWARYTNCNGDVDTEEFWKKISNGIGWKSPGCEVQCWDCKQMDKQYKMFVSFRDIELLYVAFDMPKRRTVARCLHCERVLRTSADLRWYNHEAKLGFTEKQLDDMKGSMDVELIP